ncbi:MAG: ribonuclease P protein component [Eubacteriales bacterium]
MKITEPLRLNYEFARVYKRGVFTSGRCLVLHAFPRTSYVRRGRTPVPPDVNRLGVTSSRKIRGAVKRNRVKRLLRENYRLIEPELRGGYDLILMMKPLDPLPDYFQVKREMRSLFKRAGLLKAGDST